MSAIRRIVIHCSDSPDTLDIGVREIRQWHVKDRGWSDIGYHAVVRRTGVVEIGRYEDGDSVLEGKEIGAHVAGQNSDTLAVCWVGRDKPTPEQKLALFRHVIYLMNVHKIPVERVLGHKELDAKKTCPNLDMDGFRKSLAAMAAAA